MTDSLQDRGLDPEQDYTESVPMQYSTSWIDHDNLEVLAAEAAEEEFGERVYDVEAAVVGALTGEADDDWMRSEYGHRFSMLKGLVEEKAKEYRAEVFSDELPDDDGGERGGADA